MGQSILVPVDHSSPAATALEYACEHFPDASITALHVLYGPDFVVGHAQGAGEGFAADSAEAQATADSLLADVAERAADHGVSIETAMKRGRIEPSITDYAEENDVDLIVIGSHGREGITRVTLGSVAEKVVRRSPVPVLVVR